MQSKKKVIHMVTSATSVILMKGQLSYLREAGYDVTVVASPGEELGKVQEKEKVHVKSINMERTISPFKDIISLLKIIVYFMRIKPDICNAGTPKAGLLGMIAAWITRVPLKVYTVRGLPLEGAMGVKKKILILTEKIACACADKVICISPSIKREVINLRLSNPKKTVLFGAGSSNGLQVNNYRKTDKIQNKVSEIKKIHHLESYNFIIGYVGRINNFKGIKELVGAFEILQSKHDGLALMLIGENENKDPISNETRDKIMNNPHIIEVGHVSDPIPYYFAMDILAFPTYREGFGNVSIEAQATGTPVVTTNATGAIDTVEHDETGFIVNVGEIEELEQAIEKLIVNPSLLMEMSYKGIRRVEEKFDSQIIWEALHSLYENEIK